MPEIDMRENPWNYGIPVEDTLVDRDLYKLIAVFAASRFLHSRRGNEEEGNIFGYSLRYFELPEVGRILVSVAAICRNDWDHRWEAIDERLKQCGVKPDVGILIEDLQRPRKRKPLHVRESFHKILHAHTMNFERSEGVSLYSGYLHPRIDLYGQKGDKQWKAVINVYRWAEVVHVLS